MGEVMYASPISRLGEIKMQVNQLLQCLHSHDNGVYTPKGGMQIFANGRAVTRITIQVWGDGVERITFSDRNDDIVWYRLDEDIDRVSVYKLQLVSFD